MTLFSVIFFDTDDIRRIGEIPAGLPSIVVPTFTGDIVVTMVIDALVLGTLGCIDTLLTAVIGDSLTRKEHDSIASCKGRELPIWSRDYLVLYPVREPPWAQSPTFKWALVRHCLV